MHILITGGFGYLGSSIAKHLSNQGHKITLGSRYSRTKSKFYFEHENRLIDWDSELSLMKACEGIDMVIHAAGLTASECFKNPLLADSFNGSATKRLIKAGASKKIKYFIYLSTVHVYNSNLKGLISEQTPLLNSHPYAISNIKGENETLLESKKNNINGLVLRLSNIFGPPISDDINYRNLLMGEVAYQAINNNEIKLSSNGEQLRNFMTITELCEVFSFLLNEIDIFSKVNILNIGSLWNTSILDAVKIARDVISKKIMQEIPIHTIKQNIQTTYSLNFSSQKLYELGYEPLNYVNDEINNLADFCINLKKNNEEQ